MKRLLVLVALACLAQDPALLQKGAEAMRAGHFAEAERTYRELVKSAPDDARLRLNLGLSLYSGGKYEEASAEIDRYLKANPQPGPVFLLSGTVRLKLHRPCEAIEPLERARQWQANGDVVTELADAYNGCTRYSDAAKAYREAARLKNGDVKLQRASAQAYWEAREYGQARTLYSKLEKGFAGDAQFLYEYGDTLVRVEGSEAGLPYLEKAVKANPSLLPARGALGKALLEAGRHVEAIGHLEAAANTDPALWLALSKAYRGAAREDEAARAEKEYRNRMR
jgi:predicted Zn-dependent protease